MASLSHAVFGAGAALLFWTCIGLCLTRRLMPPLALPMAPVIGWAAYNAIALLIFLVAPFSHATVLALAGSALAIAFATLRGRAKPAPSAVPAWAYALAALLAIVPAAAILPKFGTDGVYLASPIFDHVKVAMIDDMARLGFPPGNPFFADPEHPRLAYYYLWHFAAAQLALATGISGWEADAAMTWFSAAASLFLMMGLAARIGGATAAVLAVVVSATASARPVLAAILTQNGVDAVDGGIAGWLYQASWVPQHMMAATCVLAAVTLMGELAVRRSVLLVAALALVVAAGFESSTWIGGITFAVAAPATALVLLGCAAPGRRLHFLAALIAAAVLAVGVAAPLLRDQVAATSGRGAPVALQFFHVMDDAVFGRMQGLQAYMDPPAFWLLLLPLEVPAAYLIGIVGLATLARERTLGTDARRIVGTMGALALSGLSVTWLLASTLAENNDLGMRAVLPAVMALTVLAAGALSRWMARPGIAAAACIAVIMVGLAGAVDLIRSYFAGEIQPAGREFAASPALWEAVRRHTAPGERVGNNPLFLQDMTPWPDNISWGLLANRRSCYAGRETTLVYTALGLQRTDEVNAQFIRVFTGNPIPGDVEQMASRYGCRVVVVAASDGAWSRDPFAESPLFHLVEEQPDRWRIYRSASEAEP